MTPPDRKLDPSIILQPQTLRLYRLARAKYANLSGVGAAADPGRWNRLGESAIYTSTERSLPVLERLVHTAKDLIPANLAMMEIHVSGQWILLSSSLRDNTTNGRVLALTSLRQAEQVFRSIADLPGSGAHPFAVAVPSVIVPVWNVVLYPAEKGFWDHVSLHQVEPFDFDPRLFPIGMPVEPVTPIPSPGLSS